jgi:AbrB family looped-hinge helix DNA binding protein
MDYLEIVKVDEKGRVIIPKGLREKVKVKEGGYVKMRVDGKAIMIEPVESIADKYYGAFKIEKWPEDLDEFVVKVMGKWWILKAT